MVFDKNSIEDWSEVLPFSQRICNAEIVSSIGVAPAEIIFGAAIRLDRGILVPNTERLKHLEASHGSMSSYVSKLIATQQRAIEYARGMQSAKDTKHMIGAEQPITDFPVGSLVTLSYPANQDGVCKPPTKLLTKRQGPFKILSRNGTTYTIENVATKKASSVNISRLEIFQHDPARVDPIAVAAKDNREFIVEAVLEHDPIQQPAKNRKALKFLIKWKDYDASENSWVAWHNLTNNNVVLAYCMRAGMNSLVAKQYRCGAQDRNITN